MNIKRALRELNNAVLDLQCADYNTFERPLKRIALALNAEDLKKITDGLKSIADFEIFLEGASRDGGMTGSARLNWPPARNEELGLTIHLLERGAKDTAWFLSFAHTYFYGGRKFIDDIRKITAAVVIPFNRDFASYVEELAPTLFTQREEPRAVVEEDKNELLDALYEVAQASGRRPSVENTGMSHFPEWGRDRLLDAMEALIEEGMILNATGATLYVDISSTGRKLVEQRTTNEASRITYNIGTMNNSPLQHVSQGSHGIQATNYATNDLQAILELYRTHVEHLSLDEAQRRRADAQVATIAAQMMDVPDRAIINSAGKSLKAIIEGAIGGAAGNALATAALWAPLLSMF